MTDGPANSRSLSSAVAPLWSLFCAAAMLSVGNGLQATVIGVRASVEDFATVATGVIMTSYFVGFVFGTRFTLRALSRVGHIRAYAGLASVASCASLAHALIVHPVAWVIIRGITGFCLAGLFVIAESWLNERAENANRGRIMSLYMVVLMAASAGSQLLLLVGSVEGFSLFVVSSMLVSLALVPMVLSDVDEPDIQPLDQSSLATLWKIAPTGVVIVALAGVSVGALRGMASVYAADVGLSTLQIGFFVGATAIGASALQTPIGIASDRVPRRLVMLAIGALAVAVAAWAALFEPDGYVLAAVAFLLGGFTVPLYSLGIAHTNDWVTPENRVAAAAFLVLVYGIGSIFGPLTASVSMEAFGSRGFFVCVAVANLGVVLFLIWRLFRRGPPTPEQKSIFVPMPSLGRGPGVLGIRSIRNRVGPQSRA